MFTLGCDPEVMAFKKQSATPAWLLTKGTKKEPVSIVTEPHIGLKAQADGMALEFNIDPVEVSDASGIIKFARHVWTGFKALQKEYQLAQLVIGPTISPSWFTDGWKQFGHPLAMEIGCDPDFSAYAEDPTQPRKVPFTPTAETLRYMGGHIHVGYDVQMAPAWVFARLMDLFVTVPVQDRQQERRSLYGLAGLYRPKPYGMEYRTPSNYWVGNNMCTWQLGCNIMALMHGLEHYPGEMRELYVETDWNLVEAAIRSEARTTKAVLLESFNQRMAETMPDAAALLYTNASKSMMKLSKESLTEAEVEDQPEFEEQDYQDDPE